MTEYILSIDQGTTSSRAILFDRTGSPCGSAQMEHEQILPKPGWVEHDAEEIWNNVREVIEGALQDADASGDDIASIGITNQRETVIAWDKTSGSPIAPAIVWQDSRTSDFMKELTEAGHSDRVKELTGLPLTSYFSASKMRWVLENVDGAQELADSGDLLFGTPDTWVLWNLTGGPSDGVHATDVTNASRTMLMDLETLDWSEDMLDLFEIPRSALPEIRPSSGDFGTAADSTSLCGTPITGVLGDQQAATFGQTAFDAGESKNTYGTGNFLLVNTGTDKLVSHNGLITTVAYQLGDDPAHYALEGSIAVTGSLIQWLRDQLGILSDAAEVETLANDVEDSGGVTIVPAFSGLFAPYWRADARGIIGGLTRYSDKRHIARAALEAVAHQSVDVVEIAREEIETTIPELRVDGGMTVNDTLMQLQADLLNLTVIRPQVTETTALGAAYAAGLAAGFWESLSELRENWHEDQRWEPSLGEAAREEMRRRWKFAVEKSCDWAGSSSRSEV